MDSTRRISLKNSLGTIGLTSSSSNFFVGKNILGANDRINCAVVGVRSREKLMLLQ